MGNWAYKHCKPRFVSQRANKESKDHVLIQKKICHEHTGLRNCSGAVTRTIPRERVKHCQKIAGTYRQIQLPRYTGRWESETFKTKNKERNCTSESKNAERKNYINYWWQQEALKKNQCRK